MNNVGHVRRPIPRNVNVSMRKQIRRVQRVNPRHLMTQRRLRNITRKLVLRQRPSHISIIKNRLTLNTNNIRTTFGIMRNSLTRSHISRILSLTHRRNLTLHKIIHLHRRHTGNRRLTRSTYHFNRHRKNQKRRFPLSHHRPLISTITRLVHRHRRITQLTRVIRRSMEIHNHRHQVNGNTQ